MSFSDNFRNSFETSNNDSDMRLRTHYYGSDLENTKNTISRVLQNNGFHLIHVDNVYNEMLLRSKKEELIISLVEQSMYETAVNIKINTKYLISFARGKKTIDQVYQLLNKQLTLKQKGI